MPERPGRPLVAPPAGSHLGLGRIVARAEGQILDAVGTGLDVPHRVLVEPDRVPLAELDDLVSDLHPRGTSDDDVHLLLGLVLVAERDPKCRRQREQAQPERLAADRSPREPRLHLLGHAELRRLVLDLPEVLLRITAHRGFFVAMSESQTSYD